MDRKAIMQFFDYEDEQAEDMKKIVKPFGDLARVIHDQIYPHNAEVIKTLDNLLLARDSAVRAVLINRKKQK